MVTSAVTTYFFPVPGIRKLFFVPFLLAVCSVFRIISSVNYKTVLLLTLAAVVWIFIGDLFKMDIILPKLLWSCIGGVLTLVVVSIYNKQKGKVG